MIRLTSSSLSEDVLDYTDTRPPHAASKNGGYTRAVDLCRVNRFREGAEELERLLEEQPDHSEAAELLAELSKAGMHSAPRKQSASDVKNTSVFNQQIINPTTLARIAASSECWEEILSFHSLLATDSYVQQLDNYYRDCLKKYGRNWHYLDITNVLYAAAKTLKPKRYLEIGLRRGRSVCVVARGCPDTAITGFDLWIPDYAGMQNPGPEFVREELHRHGHRGNLELIDGDSRRTVPEYFSSHPDTKFDLITVDGDHSRQGALTDLKNVIPHLSAGGVIVFDDIAHPQHPYLYSVWQEILSDFPSLKSCEYTEAGYGVAFAVQTPS